MEYVVQEDKAWFCARCEHAREVEQLPIAKRVSGQGLSEAEVG